GETTGAFLPRGADDGVVEVTGARPAPLMVLTCALRCAVEVSPRLVLDGGGRSARAAAVLRLPTQRLAIDAGGRAAVRLRLTRSQRAAVRRAGSATVRLELAVTGDDGAVARDRAIIPVTVR
ncbi:MAG TPA: hypothetical protein VIL49_16170, partial [Capillimicrobium sp.]